MKHPCLVLAFCVAACAPSAGDFTRAGTSPSQAAADDRDCQAEAVARHPADSGSMLSFGMPEPQAAAYRECLLARGYVPVYGR